MGALFFSCEWKAVVNDVRYYVAFMPSYLEYDKSYMTERDYDSVCANVLNMIRNYLNCRTQKGVPCVVITVRDNNDLNNLAFNIMASGAMDAMLDNIFFTGEGILKAPGCDGKRAFLKIVKDSSRSEGYDICAAEVPFLIYLEVLYEQ